MYSSIAFVFTTHRVDAEVYICPNDVLDIFDFFDILNKIHKYKYRVHRTSPTIDTKIIINANI